MSMHAFRVLWCPSSARRPFCVSVRGAETTATTWPSSLCIERAFPWPLGLGLGLLSPPPTLSFFEAIQTEQLRLQFPLNDATIQARRCWRSVTAAFRPPHRSPLFLVEPPGGSLRSWTAATTRPAWRTLCTASWNTSVGRSKRPTMSWRRTWRLTETIAFTGGSSRPVCPRFQWNRSGGYLRRFLVCELVLLGSGESGNRKCMDGQSSPSLQLLLGWNVLQRFFFYYYFYSFIYFCSITFKVYVCMHNVHTEHVWDSQRRAAS